LKKLSDTLDDCIGGGFLAGGPADKPWQNLRGVLQMRGRGAAVLDETAPLNTSSVRRPLLNESQSGEVEADLKKCLEIISGNAFLSAVEEKQITQSKNLRPFPRSNFLCHYHRQIIFYLKCISFSDSH